MDRDLLQKFCSTDRIRYYLQKPFRKNGYTWATNGHILVRTYIDVTYPENDKAPNVEKILNNDTLQGEFIPINRLTLPEVKTSEEECDCCFGGYVHDCPDCHCLCDICEGKGFIGKSSDDNKSADIGGYPYALKYVRILYELEDVKILPKEAVHAPLIFTFKEGAGALMGLARPEKDHITEEKEGN